LSTALKKEIYFSNHLRILLINNSLSYFHSTKDTDRTRTEKLKIYT
jgi:hypothetical protein